METLEQERRQHMLTIKMGNLCGMSTVVPGGRRASSLWSEVNCADCLILAPEPARTDVLPVGRCSECDRFVCRCYEDAGS